MHLTWELGPWQALGFIGQGVFFSRFAVQWIVSERRKRSVMPLAFWYLSLMGALLLFIYAVYRKDIVFTLGQTCGFFIYIRNLMLISRQKKLNDSSPPAQE